MDDRGLPCRRALEFFLTRVCDFHRPAGLSCEKGGNRFVRIDIQLGTKGAANRRLDNPDIARMHAKCRRQVHFVIVGILGLRIDRELAVSVEVGDRTRCSHTTMSYVMNLKYIINNNIGLGLGRREIAMAEFEIQALVFGEGVLD